MPNAIRLATTHVDHERVYRFRYEIYVKEMGRSQQYADHENCRIEEPLDKTGRIFLAEDEGGRVVGTVRTNFGRDSDFGYYMDLYRMKCTGCSFPQKVSISTKLMVAPELRGGPLATRLAIAAYSHALEHGILFDFINCNPPLESMFERFGYRRYTGRIQHPEYGDVLPLVLPVTDLEHLEDIGSPFARICSDSCPHLRANRHLRELIAGFQENRDRVPSTTRDRQGEFERRVNFSANFRVNGKSHAAALGGGI